MECNVSVWRVASDVCSCECVCLVACRLICMESQFRVEILFPFLLLLSTK